MTRRRTVRSGARISLSGTSTARGTAADVSGRTGPMASACDSLHPLPMAKAAAQRDARLAASSRAAYSHRAAALLCLGQLERLLARPSGASAAARCAAASAATWLRISLSMLGSLLTRFLRPTHLGLAASRACLRRAGEPARPGRSEDALQLGQRAMRACCDAARRSSKSRSLSRPSFNPGACSCGALSVYAPACHPCGRMRRCRSIHVLEADPQVIPAGHQRQRRRRPQRGQADGVRPRWRAAIAADLARSSPAARRRGSARRGDELEGRLPLGELATPASTPAAPPRNSRRPETAISRIRMISPAITCRSPT